MINRRGLITSLIAFGAAPAIVRVESLMKVKAILPVIEPYIGFDEGLIDFSYIVFAKRWINEDGKLITEYIDFKDVYIDDYTGAVSIKRF